MHEELGERLRARGKRLTSQRARVLEAVSVAGHATPEEVAALVAADGGTDLSLSTVYRSLEALQELGLLTHTHVDHRVPSYHLASHPNHVHLSCRSCGALAEVPADLAQPFVDEVERRTGFRAEMTHAAVHGHCARCREEGR